MYTLADKLGFYTKIFYNYRLGRDICSYLPSHLWIEPTNICNLECIICPGSDSDREKGYMPFDLFRGILDRTANAPVVYLFMAGEPLLHPDIFKMIRHTNRIGASSNLFTNATLLDGVKAHKLIESEPDWLGFSFDGCNRETYERVRKNASFDLTLANIERFLRLKSGLRKKRPYTCLSLIEAHEFSTGETPELRKSFKKSLFSMGLDQFDVSPPHTWAGKIHGFASNRRRKGAEGVTRCPAPWSSLTILWDGRVVPCCFDVNAEYVVGDVSKNTLAEIWNDLPMRNLRKAFISGRADGTPLCRSCHIIHDPAILGIPRKAWVEAYEMVKIRLSQLRG